MGATLHNDAKELEKIMETGVDGHPFEKLCTQAATKRWCWDLYCTTCGAMDLRRALWRLATSAPAPPGTQLCRAWPVEVQRSLIEAVASAPVERMVRDSPFPDGLGYLGMVLSVTSEAEEEGRRLTRAWCPQLVALVDEEPSLFFGPDTEWPARGPDAVLRWEDLERVESAMRDRR